MDLACQIALDATSTVFIEENGRKEIDIKRYAKVEKVINSRLYVLCIIFVVCLIDEYVCPVMCWKK